MSFRIKVRSDYNVLFRLAYAGFEHIFSLFFGSIFGDRTSLLMSLSPPFLRAYLPLLSPPRPQRTGRGKHRARSNPPPPSLLSPPSPQARAQAQAPSPSASSCQSNAPAEGTIVGAGGPGGSGRGGGGGGFEAQGANGGGALGYPQPQAHVTGFDLQAALESRDIGETKGHMRALYDLVRDKERLRGQRGAEGWAGRREGLGSSIADQCLGVGRGPMGPDQPNVVILCLPCLPGGDAGFALCCIHSKTPFCVFRSSPDFAGWAGRSDHDKIALPQVGKDSCF